LREIRERKIRIAQVHLAQVLPLQTFEGEVNALSVFLPPFIPYFDALLQDRQMFRVGHVRLQWILKEVYRDDKTEAVLTVHFYQRVARQETVDRMEVSGEKRESPKDTAI
jgi:hypothetical protein